MPDPDRDQVKAYLHRSLRTVRDSLVWKIEGLSEYDIRRPLTPTGTNLLGLIKHCAVWDARYFGEVFDRPFASTALDWQDPVPAWNDPVRNGPEAPGDSWVAAERSREQILELYDQVSKHTDATIETLQLGSVGYVPWWDESVPLFNIMVHCLTETTRHAGHADILRENIDGSVGVNRETPPLLGRSAKEWAERRKRIEAAAERHRDWD